jgi:glucokinase
MSQLYIDIGGTKLRSELVLKNETIKEEVPSNSVELTSYIENKIDKDLKEVFISFAGQVNNGKIISSPNIKIKEKNITKYFDEKYSIRLKIDNDLNCALRAESRYFNEKNLALIFIGTGIGSAVMENNLIIKGENNLAGEIGHIPFKKSPFKCGCGKNNCIENFTSGIALKKWYDFYKLKDKTISEIKKSKNPYEKMIYNNFIEGFLTASATIVTLFNPKLLVLGGGIIKSNNFLYDILKDNIEKYALKASCNKLDIQISKLDNASLEGAKLL